jgi:hypothetical protein
MCMNDAADIGVVDVQGGVHVDHGALYRRQLALQQRSVKPHPDYCRSRVVPQ